MTKLDAYASLTRLGSAAAAALTCVALCLLGALAPVAGAKTKFRPRIGGAMGIAPVPGGPDIAVGSSVPVVYHGGPVMRGVTVHTIFWAPAGFRFGGPPSAGALGYEQLVQRFFGDVAHDSGSTANVFSVLSQFGDTSGPGGYSIQYSAASGSIDDTNPYPHASQQCPSPAGVATCLTDLELRQEIDRVIQSSDPAARGLGNLWLIFLPPDVDTCTSIGSCGSNVYGGYHGSFDLGHGIGIYAVIPDPLIEATLPAGSDPQGNPDAESAINVAAHETVEAMTNPQGDGWMDPNGFEVGDKCEAGPQQGAPIGYAADGSPYNQLINGDKWLIQMMWSQAAAGCVQSSSVAAPAPALAQVRLTQFSPLVSGNIGVAKAKVEVTAVLLRANTLVAVADTRTRADGAWGPVPLVSLTRSRVVAFGDDRDEIDVAYGTGGPPGDAIVTGDGGNPFTQSGWTGWFDLDHGFAVQSGGSAGGVLVGPCTQTGRLRLTVGRARTESPTDLCGTETDVAVVSTGRIAAGTALHLESTDNRAVSAGSPNGALVSLTVPLGEANSISALGNSQIPFEPTGFPSCTADLRSQRVSCTGLVPGASYSLTRRRGRATRRATAGDSGTIKVAGLAAGITGGDVLTLRNSARRTLTALHVAHLRVHILGAQTTIASGVCEAGSYYGLPPTSPPTNAGIGAPGLAGSGTVCPPDGSARGLATGHIEQTDDLSGGMTVTEVPKLEFTTPSDGATLYGQFTALAGAGITTARGAVTSSPGPIALTITRASGGRAVFRAANVNTAGGVAVAALGLGTYTAKWVVTDANGDTRTVLTRFVEVG